MGGLESGDGVCVWVGWGDGGGGGIEFTAS